MVAETSKRHSSDFLKEIVEATPNGERLFNCLQCGSCGGSCPNGSDMQFTPRAIFAMINADQRNAVLTSNTMWCCVSCYLCMSRCPQDVPITEVMYALKRIAIKEKLASNTDAPALARTFTDLVDKYGRSFELGLASRYYLFNKPLSMLKLGPLGMSMLTRGRMSLTPTKIRQIDQLQAIIKKAKEMGGAA